MNHRKRVGGKWDEMGRLQFEFLRGMGLEPSSRLLDIGCGCLRAGVRFVEYLDAGNYFGTDKNRTLLKAGYEIELKALGLQGKMPRSNLVCDGEFRFPGLDAKFDFALAQSLFTHLPATAIRQCLARLPERMNAGGKFFASYLLVPEEHPAGEPYDHPSGLRTFDGRDPFHYRRSSVHESCAGLPWSVSVIGEWNHPRDQQMVAFALP